MLGWSGIARRLGQEERSDAQRGLQGKAWEMGCGEGLGWPKRGKGREKGRAGLVLGWVWVFLFYF